MSALIDQVKYSRRRIAVGESVRVQVSPADPNADVAGIRMDRDRRALPVDVVVHLADTRKWRRGAAVLAIQRYVLGIDDPEL